MKMYVKVMFSVMKKILRLNSERSVSCVQYSSLNTIKLVSRLLDKPRVIEMAGVTLNEELIMKWSQLISMRYFILRLE
jgi:hypothetical protein